MTCPKLPLVRVSPSFFLSVSCTSWSEADWPVLEGGRGWTPIGVSTWDEGGREKGGTSDREGARKREGATEREREKGKVYERISVWK